MSQKSKGGFRRYEDPLDRRANKAHKIQLQRQRDGLDKPGNFRMINKSVEVYEDDLDFEDDLYDLDTE